ncbi:MAG: sigma-70 family RNA polymerase sigma factor [Myxococcaceae bacterium]|nr:sigma-70 family RNA polymerase sigma factor [Myxococcaceae bacterium]MCA3011456.1 sigma-70 family RNA polymerase sigma factor [Myxococcaceae bacterium]
MSGFSPKVTAAYERHRAAVFRRCLSLLKDAALAEDATQDVFLKLAANEQRLTNPQALLAWLLQTATNHSMTLMRGARKTESLDEPKEGTSPAEPSHQVTGQYEARQLSKKLLDELGTMSQDIALSVLAGDEERQEAAARLSVSRKTVTRKIQSISARALGLLTKKRHD